LYSYGNCFGKHQEGKEEVRFKNFYLSENEETFDIKILDSFKKFSDKIKYAKSKLTKLGEGSSRIVFDMKDGYVLKLAKNEKGLEQNLTDGDWGIQRMYPDLVPELKERDENDDCYWLIVKAGKKITPNRFKELTKMSFKEFGKALTDVELNYNGKRKLTDGVKQLLDDEDSILSRVSDMMMNFDITAGDLTRISSWGEVDGKAKILDAGLTKTTFNTHYRKR